MVTKAKEPVVETETKEESSTIDKGELREALKEILPEFLGGAKTEEVETDEPAADDGKVVTAREEEARSHNLVMEAIKEFKKEFAGEDDTKSEKKEPEAEPGKKPTPWIQRVMWGIE